MTSFSAKLARCVHPWLHTVLHPLGKLRMVALEWFSFKVLSTTESGYTGYMPDMTSGMKEMWVVQVCIYGLSIWVQLLKYSGERFNLDVYEKSE